MLQDSSEVLEGIVSCFGGHVFAVFKVLCVY